MTQEPSNLAVKGITILKSLQCRRGLDDYTLSTYVGYLVEDTSFEFKPISVMKLPDDRRVVIDGFHRHEAYRAAGRETIPAITYHGTMEDAIKLAAGCNTEHGLPRTASDKRRAVVSMLRHPDYQTGAISMRDIAKHCVVSHTMVQDTAKKLDLKKPKGGENDSPEDPKAVDYPEEVLKAISIIGTTNPGAADSLLTGVIIKPHDEIIRYSEYPDDYRQALAPLFFGRRLSLMASLEIVERKPTDQSSLRDAINYVRMQGSTSMQFAFDNNTALITVSLFAEKAESKSNPLDL